MYSGAASSISRSAPSGSMMSSRKGRGPSGLLEDAEVGLDAHRLQRLVEPRHDAGGLEAAGHLAGVVEALLLEDEDVLHRDDVALEPGDLGDVRHLALPVPEANGLDDD